MEILHIATIAVSVTAASAWLLYDFRRNLRDAAMRGEEAASQAVDSVPRWLRRERPRSSREIGALPPVVSADDLPQFVPTRAHLTTPRRRRRRRTHPGGNGPALRMSA